jgi:hypothetical protein
VRILGILKEPKISSLHIINEITKYFKGYCAMNSSIIILKSITEANKAKQQLGNYRIKSTIEKVTVQRGGCGYGIRVYADPEKLCRLLSIVDIECGEIICGKERR